MQVKINPLVALDEAGHLIDFYRNRALLNAQGKHDLGEQVAELQAKVETFLAEAGAVKGETVEAVDPTTKSEA